jgi:CHAT domain-containing protein
MPERAASATWGEDLSDIRNELGRLLFSNLNNRKFYKVLIEAKTRVGGTQNTRIRFVVNEGTHPIMLEAIEDVDSDPGDYLMLKAPVYRRYEARGEGYPLFKDRASRRGPINCLIIQADPRDGELGAPWNTPLAELPSIEGEVNAIHEILAAERENHKSIGKLEVFRAAQWDGRAVEKLEALMQGTRWHLVHFAGHSVRSRDGQGAIVLSSRGDGVLSARRLGELLSNTQFLYLSSCRSADAYFVMHLVEQQVPGVLGFRWPVADEQAHKYARYFYHSLFNDVVSRQFLEYAFLKAKRKLYDRDENDPTWAAPVLIMQVDNPEEDLTESAVTGERIFAGAAGPHKGEGDVRNTTEL